MALDQQTSSLSVKEKDGKAFDGEFFNYSIGPFAELHRLGGIHLMAYRNNCFQIIMLRIVDPSVRGGLLQNRNF